MRAHAPNQSFLPLSRIGAPSFLCTTHGEAGYVQRVGGERKHKGREIEKAVTLPATFGSVHESKVPSRCTWVDVLCADSSRSPDLTARLCVYISFKPFVRCAVQRLALRFEAVGILLL